MRLSHTVLAIAVMTLTTLALSGCSTATVEYIPEGGAYTLAEVQERAVTIDAHGAESIATDDAYDERVDRLVYLRKQGEEPAALADALTSGFPTENASVPILVERGTVDEQPVWIIIEAWGEPGAKLEHRRLWLLDDRTLDVVNASSFR
jgi:uncharacterized protein YceK